LKCSSCWVRFYSEWVDYSWLEQHPTTDAYRPLFYSIFSNYLLVSFPPRHTSACHAVLSFYKRLKLLASNIRAEKAGLAEWNQSLLDLHFHQVSYLWHWFSCWLTTILSKRCYRCHIESSLTVSLAVVNMPILCLFQLLIRVCIYIYTVVHYWPVFRLSIHCFSIVSVLQWAVQCYFSPPVSLISFFLLLHSPVSHALWLQLLVLIQSSCKCGPFIRASFVWIHRLSVLEISLEDDTR